MTYPPEPRQQDPHGPQSGQQPPPQGYPPQQYAPVKKKGGAGKVLLIVAIAVVVLCGGSIAIVGLVASKSGSSGGGGTTAVHAGMNQPARDGKFQFTVTKVQCGVPKVGDEVLSKTAQGQFCLVAVTVKNIGKDQQMFDGGSQKAKGPDGATYGNDSEAEIYANKDTATFLNQINPGNSVTGVLVFDIPKAAKISTLELHDSPFSGGVIVAVA